MMSDDRELLEAAARAAGIEGDYRTENLCVNGDWLDVTAIFLADGMGWWNPLTDDGDALRLAVKLNLHVGPVPTMAGPEGMRYAQDNDKTVNVPERSEGDPYAATRRAIVRAAAAMAGTQGEPA
jgi:hypothetical protein